MSEIASEPQSEEEYTAIADSVTLPAWMDFPTEEKDVYVLRQDGNAFVLDGRDEPFTSIEEAYDFVEAELNATIDLSEVSKPGELVVTDNHRLLISFTPTDSLRMQRFGYWSFLQLNEKYEENPEDFYTAYYWLQSHPAFYYRHENNLNRWIQDDGLGAMNSSVMSEGGEVHILLEHGANTDEKRVGNNRYADYRLDSWGDTFEQAYVRLAQLVHINFDINGVDRELEGDKPQWLVDAIDRLDDYEEDKA